MPTRITYALTLDMHVIAETEGLRQDRGPHGHGRPEEGGVEAAADRLQDGSARHPGAERDPGSGHCGARREAQAGHSETHQGVGGISGEHAAIRRL